MEEKRVFLAANGYYIRRLNQAYFAFHGSYADSAGSIDPIGPKLDELRRTSASLREFVSVVRGSRRRRIWIGRWRGGSREHGLRPVGITRISRIGDGNRSLRPVGIAQITQMWPGSSTTIALLTSRVAGVRLRRTRRRVTCATFRDRGLGRGEGAAPCPYVRRCPRRCGGCGGWIGGGFGVVDGGAADRTLAPASTQAVTLPALTPPSTSMSGLRPQASSNDFSRRTLSRGRQQHLLAAPAGVDEA